MQNYFLRCFIFSNIKTILNILKYIIVWLVILICWLFLFDAGLFCEIYNIHTCEPYSYKLNNSIAFYLDDYVRDIITILYLYDSINNTSTAFNLDFLGRDNNVMLYFYDYVNNTNLMPYLYGYFYNTDVFFYKSNNLNLIEFIYNYPFFISCGLLFFFTTTFSIISINYLGLYGIFMLNLITIFIFWLSSLVYIWSIFYKNVYFFISIGKWIHINNDMQISFDILVDNVSLSFLFLTLTIGLFVYIYTFSYFKYEPFVERLLIFLNFFMLSMILLVLSGNFIIIILGWEFIGLTSFFLINFWSNRVGTFKSAFKAYTFNKFSDVFLLFAIILIYNVIFNLDILNFNNQIYLYELYSVKICYFNINILDFISLFLILCICIKSAQIGGHLWLPDSMEAPVPASALIHSATLVSAGIYLLLRLSPLFELSFLSIYILPIIGAFTAFYGGITAAFQSDTKKTLAYSTISHCGFLVLLYTTGVLEFVILYLYVHGFFKAATFLCFGSINRFCRNVQDFKRMGVFYKYLPFECFAAFVCLINLSGLPLTIGFYTKHLLFISLVENIFLYYLVYSLTIVASLSGIFYSSRLFYSVFFDIKKAKKAIFIQTTNKILNSKYYTNSSIIINIIVVLMLITSYIIILFLYNLNLSSIYTMSDLKTNQLYNSYTYFLQPTFGFLINISVINIIIVIFLFICIFINWRFNYNLYMSYISYNNSLVFMLLMFIFYKYF